MRAGGSISVSKSGFISVSDNGYLPIDKTGADLLFQVFSQRYENGSTIVTTNQAYKHWAKMSAVE